MKSIVFIPVIIILLYLIIVYGYQGYLHSKLISGIWHADEDFCDSAGLDAFIIHIDDDVRGGRRGGYLLAQNIDSDVVINTPTIIHTSMNWSDCRNWTTNITKPRYLTVRFDDAELDEEVFPKKQNLVFYPLSSKIVLLNGDTMSGVFYKDNLNTELKFIKQEESD